VLLEAVAETLPLVGALSDAPKQGGEECSPMSGSFKFAPVAREHFDGIFEYPDHEAALRVLPKIAKLEVFETETFPAEEIKLFFKEFV
jgi:hypothetical protein